MRISYDPEVDALYIRFIETTVTTQHLKDGVSVDYTSGGQIAGIEILDALKHIGDKNVFRKLTFEELSVNARC